MNELKPHEMFMKNNNLKKSGVKVQYSEDDIKEIIKCKNDVIYFIEKYVKIISTDDGKVPFKMYPFQKTMIQAYKDHQQVICLTCRQAGKCVVGDTEIEVLSPEGKKKKIAIGELYAILRNQEGQFGSGSDTKGTGFMSVPTEKLSGSEVDCRWSGKETHLAGTLEISPIEKKFVHSQKVRGWKINGSCGWAPLTYIHKTVPYEVWNIEFENGNHVRCADNHIFIGLFDHEIFAKHLYPGIMIKSKEGITKVRTVNLFHVKEEMYDPEIELGFQPHYFSNGILSHNTTTSAAFLLWQMLFTTDLTVAILANKAATAHEILDRLKLMYECLPLFLQPGVVVWNKTSIELANNCKALSAATSSSSIRGMSISCVTGDTLVCVENDEEEIFYTTIDKINESKLVNEENYEMKTDTPKKYYTVYRIFNRMNGKEYVGFHGTNDLNDGYMGSGKLIRKAIEKYGPENFEKEYITIFDKKEDAEELERNIVNYECVLREDTYNLSIRGNVNILYGESNGFYGKKHSEESIQKMSEKHKGGRHSDETKEILSKASKERWSDPEYHKRCCEAIAYGISQMSEEKKIVSAALKGSIYIHNPETGEVKRFPKDHEIILPWVRGTGKRK